MNNDHYRCDGGRYDVVLMPSEPPTPQLAPRGRPPRITAEQIAAAALDIGLDAFTMRQIADRLGVTPQALYRHVHDRHHVEALAIDLVADRFVIPDPQQLTWWEFLEQLGLSLYQLAVATPGLSDSMTRLGDMTPVALSFIERCDTVLTDAGFTAFEAFRMGSMVANTALDVGGRVQRGTARQAADGRQVASEFYAAIERIGPDRLPVLVSAIGEFTAIPIEEHVRWRFRSLITGMAAMQHVPLPQWPELDD